MERPWERTYRFSELDLKRNAALERAVRRLGTLGIVAEELSPPRQELFPQESGRYFSHHQTVTGTFVNLVGYDHFVSFESSNQQHVSRRAFEKFRSQVANAIFGNCYNRTTGPDPARAYKLPRTIPAVYTAELVDAPWSTVPVVQGIETEVFLGLPQSLRAEALKLPRVGPLGVKLIGEFAEALQADLADHTRSRQI